MEVDECGTGGGEESAGQTSDRALPCLPGSTRTSHGPLYPTEGPLHKARGFSVLPAASASLRISTWSGTLVSIKVS